MLLRWFTSIASRQQNIIQWGVTVHLFPALSLWHHMDPLKLPRVGVYTPRNQQILQTRTFVLASQLANLCCCLVTVMSDSQTITPQTITYQGPLPMGFSRQEYWSWLPFPFPGDFPDPEIKPMSPTLAGRFFTPGPPGKQRAIYTSTYLRGRPHLSRHYWFCAYLEGRFPLLTFAMLWY